MTESANPVRDNPLSSDMVLFDMYLSALDAVVAEPDIDAAFDEFGLSAATLRMEMVRGAERVLGSAPREFAAYQNAKAVDSGAVPIRAGSSQDPTTDLTNMLRWLWIRMAVAAVLITVSGAASFAAWPWTQWLMWAGAAMLADAAVLRLSPWFIPRLLTGTLNAEGSAKLVAARNQLMAAISKTELLAQARTFINTERQSRFGYAYAVVSSLGLSDVYNSANRVPTLIAAELDGLIGRVGGASIGVAGPRGSGKSTLIREYCEEDSSAADDYEELEWTSLLSSDLPKHARGDLRCMVAAPVDYVARDFVLHLFAAFCRAVIGRYGRKTRGLSGIVRSIFWLRQVWWLLSFLLWRVIFYGGLAAALLYWQNAIARWLAVPSAWVRYAAIAVICVGIVDVLRLAAFQLRWGLRRVGEGGEKALAAEARKHRSRVRYLQTHTSEWSGALSLLRGAAMGQHKRGVSRAEQPLSYPEIVDDFRDFASKVAKNVHGTGDRVFIGVDELDKIGSAEQAEHFLNEIKGIFGVPNLYFMVSVSDDALTAFERRGLPLRDAFDSSFDEIVHVGPLNYAESRRLLYRRVIGLPEPYVALCHCLAGGLARELIRAARQVVRTATTLASADPSMAARATSPVDDFGFLSPGYVLSGGDHDDQPLTLSVISAAVVQDELRRKLHAVRHVLGSATVGNATELQDTLHDIPRYLAPGQPVLNIVDVMARPGHEEPPEVASLRLDFSAYAYYCATLQEVFTDGVGSQRIVQATSTTTEPPESGSFDALAAARNAFTIDTTLAWRLITKFREEWCLETREPVKKHPREA